MALTSFGMLSAIKKMATYTPGWQDGSALPKPRNAEDLLRAQTYYQSASWLYHNGGLKAQ